MNWFEILKVFYLISAIGSGLYLRFYIQGKDNPFGFQLFIILFPLINTALAMGFIANLLLDILLFALRADNKK